MTNPGSLASPQTCARIGGVLYLIIIFIGAAGEALIRGRLIVSGDAAATAANLRASEFLWRLGIAGELVLLISAVALTLVFYIMLKPVSRELALLAVFFNLVSIALEAAASLHLVQTLFPLANADYLKVFDSEQLHTLAYLSGRAHGHGFGVALVFFGCVCLLLGYLIYRSRYFPRILGVLFLIAGLGYLINSFALILAPSLAALLFPWILLPALPAELGFALWLLVKGVDLPKWREATAG
jgi:hypothetical protein